MKLWFTENRVLIFTVAIALITGSIFYIYSATSPLEHNQRAQSITKNIERVYRESEPSERSMNIAHLLLGEIVRSQETSFWRGLGQHVALALFVAGFLILFVEIRSRQERRKEAELYINRVAENVWKAVSGRLVPDEICKEIDGVLKCDVLKNDCQYTITIGVPYEKVNADSLVVRREVSYAALNLTGVGPITYPLRASIRNILSDIEVELDGVKVTLPRHIRFKIDGKDIPEEEYLGSDNGRELHYDLSIARDKARNVYLVWDEICKLTDTNIYMTGTPMRNLRVSVINRVPEKLEIKAVHLLHPRATDFRQTQDNLWIFDGGVLPGQAFTISWGPRK